MAPGFPDDPFEDFSPRTLPDHDEGHDGRTEHEFDERKVEAGDLLADIGVPGSLTLDNYPPAFEGPEEVQLAGAPPRGIGEIDVWAPEGLR